MTKASDLVDDGSAVLAEHEVTYNHTLIGTALQPADVGTAAYEDAGAFDAAGTAASAISTHESTYDHGDIATALQPGDVGSAAYENTSEFDPAGTAASVIATHNATYDHTLISSAIQSTDLASGTITPETGDLDLTLVATAVQPDNLSGGLITPAFGDLDLTLVATALQPGAAASDIDFGTGTDGYAWTSDGAGGAAWEAVAGGGTVTSVAVSGTDGIEVDSGSPITGAGTITLGINASTLKTHLSMQASDVAFGTGTDGYVWTSDGAGGAAWEAAAGGSGGGKTITGSTWFYVRTDGSDSNDGKTNSSGGAFLTIQKAIDTISSTLILTGDVNIYVGSGTYTDTVIFRSYESLGTTGGIVIISGAGAGSTIISNTYSCMMTKADTIGNYEVTGVSITSTGGPCVNLTHHCNVVMYNLSFTSAVKDMIIVSDGAKLYLLGSITIGSGSFASFILATNRGQTIFYNGTITLTSTLTFTSAFIRSSLLSLVKFAGSLSFSGSATGSRYKVDTNAVINTYGSGSTYLPGDSAGSEATGGIYI